MKLPDGSRLPSLLQTLAIVAQPINFLERCAQTYGDTFTLRVLGVNSPPVVFFSNPDSIQAIFTTLADSFEFGKVTHIFRPLVGDQSVIMQEGQRHQRQRQLLMPALHREQLYGQGRVICDLTRQQMSDWSIGRSLTIREEMSEISLQVILQVVFGMVPGARYERLKQLLSHLLEAITSPLYSTQFFFPMIQQNLGCWSPWGGFLAQQQEIDALIYAEINDRRSQSLNGRTDILSVLMTAIDDQGESMSDVELRDQLMTLLLLGHETTASGLAWAFYWVHRHPDCLDRLLTELQTLGQNPDPTALSQLPYLTAVCKEALRVYPSPSSLNRVKSSKPSIWRAMNLSQGQFWCPAFIWRTIEPRLTLNQSGLTQNALSLKNSRPLSFCPLAAAVGVVLVWRSRCLK